MKIPKRAYNLNIWQSRDPIGERGGINLYAYVANNPVNAVDPFGLFELPRQCAGRIAGEVWERHKDNHGDPSRREAHCEANCRISRECLGGKATAWAASWYKELSGPNGRGGTGWNPDDSPGDMEANKKGRRLASCEEKNCEELCKGTR